MKSDTVSTFSPSVCHEVMGLDAMFFVFWTLNFKPAFTLSSFTFFKRFFSSSLSAIKVISSVYLRLLIFLPTVLTPSSGAFCMMYCAYKLNKHSDNLQAWHTHFPIWNQSIVPCPVPTVAGCPAYSFLRRQVIWSGILISLRIFQEKKIFHSLLWSIVKGFSIVSEAEVDGCVFLEFPCFFLWSSIFWQFDLLFLCLF